MRSLTQWFGQHTKRAGHENASAGAMSPRPAGVQSALPSICVDHLHAQCSLRERKTSCGNTKCPRVHITLPQIDTSVHDIPELRTHLQYLPTLLVAVDRRSKHSNPLVIRLPTRHALFTVGITKAVDCAFHGGQRVPYVCYDFLERTCAYGSQCYGIHVVDFDLQSVPRERFRAAIGERDLPNADQPSRNPAAHHVRTASQGSSHSHHVRTTSQSSAAGLSVLSSFPAPTREVAIPVPDAFSMTCVETEPGWMSGMETTCSSEFEEPVVHPHLETVRMMHDGVQMVNAAHEANVALMADVETYFSAAERVLRVAKQTCAQQCQAVVAKRLHDVSEHLQTLLSLQRSPQPPSASLRMTHDILMSNAPHNLRTVAPHETAVSFVGDIIVPRITYARHDGVVESVNPPIGHPPAGWNPMPQSTSATSVGGFTQASSGIPHSMSAGVGASVSAQAMPSPLLQSMPSPSTQPVSQAGEVSLTGPSSATANSAVDEEEWAVVQLLQMVQSALSH